MRMSSYPGISGSWRASPLDIFEKSLSNGLPIYPDFAYIVKKD